MICSGQLFEIPPREEYEMATHVSVTVTVNIGELSYEMKTHADVTMGHVAAAAGHLRRANRAVAHMLTNSLEPDDDDDDDDDCRRP